MLKRNACYDLQKKGILATRVHFIGCTIGDTLEGSKNVWFMKAPTVTPVEYGLGRTKEKLRF